MANRVRGISVELSADTTKLQTALKGVNTQIRSTQSQLKDVEKLLKLDPTNTELLSQKQKLLKQAVGETKDKLDTLKTAQEQVLKSKDNYDAWKQKFDPIKTKIDETTEKLKKLKEKSSEMEKSGNINTDAYNALQKEIEDTSTDLKNLKKDAKNVSDEFGNPISPEQYDALQREIIETEQNLQTLQEQAGKTSTSLEKMAAHGQKMQEFGSKVESAGKALMPITAAVGTVGTAAVKTTADFESAMSKVSAISGVTGDDLKELSDKAREMGAKTKFSASEAANAFEFMSMAGWKKDEMMGGIEGIMNLAAASGESLGTTSDIVTDALTAFGLKADDSSHFADVLAAASSNANTNVSMMGETFKYVAPVAGSMGYSIEDMAAAIGVLANNGIKSSQAGTTLRKSITSLAAPTKKSSDMMKSLGFYASETVTQFDQQAIDEQMLKVEKATLAADKAQTAYNVAVSKYGEDSAQAEAALANMSIKQKELANAETKLDAIKSGEVQTIYSYNKAIQNEDGSMKSFSETLSFLRENLKDKSEAEKAAAVSTIFGSQAMGGMLALINTSDEDLGKLTSAIDNCDGKTQEMAETMQNNLSGQLTILKSQLQELAISFGEILLPKIKQIVSWVQGVIDKLNAMDEKTKTTIIAVSLIVAAIGPLLIVLGKFIGGIGGAISTFSKMGSAIGGFMGKMGGFSGIFSKIGTAISGISAPVLAVVAVIAVLVAAFVHLWKNNENFRNNIIAIWEGIVSKIQSFIQAIKERFSSLNIDFSTVVEVLKNLWDTFCNVIAPVFESAFQLISDTLSAVLDVLVGVLDVFIGIFTGNWEQVWEGVKGIFVALWGFIVNTLKNVLNMLKNISDNILQLWGTNWENFWGTIKDFYVNLWNSIVTFFSGILTSIKEKAVAIFTTISEFFTNVWNTISGVMNTIKETITTVWNAIYTFFEPLLNAFAYLFETIWTAIKILIHNAVTAIHDKIVEIWNAIYGFLEPILTTIFNIYKSIWTAIFTTISTVFTNVKNFITTVWNAIVSFLTPILNSIKNTVSNIFNGIKTNISNIMNNIKTNILNIWENVKNGVSSKISGIKDKIIEGFNNAVNYVKGLVGSAWSWGADMVQNIINGLRDKINDLANAVIDVANTIRDYLHFSVPDKGPLTDYATWMPDFMQGMAKGIEKSRSLIQGAIKNVSGDMVITPNVYAMLNGNKNNSDSAISSSSNQNITYNFNQTNNSPKSLSRFEIYRQSKNLLSTVKGR